MRLLRLALLAVLFAAPALGTDLDEACPKKISIFARIAGPNWPREFAIAGAVLIPLGGYLGNELWQRYRQANPAPAVHQPAPMQPAAPGPVIDGSRPLEAPEWREAEGEEPPLPLMAPTPAGAESPATYGLSPR